jgi:hypothetical protein
VPDDHAPHRQPVPVQYQVRPHLAVDLAQGGLVVVDIIPEAGEAPGDGVVGVLGIGQPQADHALQKAQCLDALVAAGVVDQGEPQPAPDGVGQGGQDLRHEVGRRHKVDVVRPLAL